MGKYEDILKLLEEKGYKKLKTHDGFDFYSKDTIKERGDWKGLIKRVYALGDEFPLVLWSKEKRDLNKEEEEIIKKGEMIPLDGNLEERIKSQLEGRRKYFMNEKQKEAAQEKYLKRVLCSLSYQPKPKKNYSHLTSKKWVEQLMQGS